MLQGAFCGPNWTWNSPNLRIYIYIYVYHTVYNIPVADEQHCLHTVNLSLSEKWSTPNPLVYHGLSSFWPFFNVFLECSPSLDKIPQQGPGEVGSMSNRRRPARAQGDEQMALGQGVQREINLHLNTPRWYISIHAPIVWIWTENPSYKDLSKECTKERNRQSKRAATSLEAASISSLQLQSAVRWRRQRFCLKKSWRTWQEQLAGHALVESVDWRTLETVEKLTFGIWGEDVQHP